MPRFYVPCPRIENGMMRITGEEVRHIRKVLRLKEGDRISVFDGSTKEYEGPILKGGLSSILVRIENISSSLRESPLEITLAQSLLKGEKMDHIVQKATELGAREIIPFLSSRSIPLLDRSKTLRRHQRWERISVEASKQCGRGMPPGIALIQDYSVMIQSAPGNALRLILWEREGRRLKEILESSEEKGIFFVIGPEGGLSEEEMAYARERGFIPVTLGKRILRSETASLCFLSILQYEMGDMG